MLCRAAAVAAFVAHALVVSLATASAAEPEVVAVVACDPYADLKKQVRWVGTLADQPALDALVETPLMMATQFKGLAGLDTTRPAGLVVTAAGDVPAIHAYVPVKDLGKLLEALQGVTGPVEEVDGIRRISPPGGMPLDIVEKNGWAIVGPQGAASTVADPTALFGGVVNQFSLGVQAFPSRMPAGMRQRFKAMLDQAAATAAAQGQPIDPAGLAGVLENVDQTESLTVGVAIDIEGERVSLESQSRMLPESKAAGVFADAAKGAVTVASPATADGKPAALSLHLAMAVPESLRQAAIEGLSTIKAQEGSDASTETAVVLLKEALAAMIAAGGYDAALSVDTSAVLGKGPTKSLPVMTAGFRVKDGAALEAKVKKIVTDAGKVPGLTVAFDSGKAAGANLHTITITEPDAADGNGGERLEMTLAVTPTHAFLLAGGEVPKRLAAVVGASGKPDADVKPMADVSLALGPVLRYLAAIGRAQEGESEEAAGMEAAANVADAQKSSLVQLLARPIERGLTLRLSADAGAIRTVASSVKVQARPARPPLPAAGGPAAIPFPVPAQ